MIPDSPLTGQPHRNPVRIRTRAEEHAPGLVDGPMPTTGPLVDTYGRIHRDLRISVTDRCNLRCTYCMPVEGIVFLPRSELLTFEEITRVARVAHRLGVRAVRLSGGEPLLRRDLHVLVAMIAGIGFDDIALTTNGTFLSAQAGKLVRAGLRRVNVSCDSLDPHRFPSIRRGGKLETVLASMDAAEALGLAPVKVNVVLVRGVNDDEVEAFAEFGRVTGRTVRFIEFMPLDAEGAWDRSAVVPSDEVIETINRRWPVEAVMAADDPAPANRYRYTDGAGEIGVVASVTRPFCADCDRLRLTADGHVRNCLFAREEVGLTEILRTSASFSDIDAATDAAIDAAIEAALRRSIWRKRAGHGIDDPDFARPRRTMSMIGG